VAGVAKPFAEFLDKIATTADQSFVATTLFSEFMTRRGHCEFIYEARKV